MGIATAACLLAGCQTFETGGEPEIAIETATLASNELNRLGRQDIAAGNFGLAERHFREAVERNKDDASSWLGLAAAYDNLRRFELADRAYAQVARIEGETLPLINNRAYSFYLRGDRRRALKELRRAQALAPDNIVTQNNLRLILDKEQPNRKARP